MRVFNIDPIDSSTGLNHISTSWKITTDEEGNNIIDSIENSSDYLTSWFTNIVMPSDTIYYLFFNRYFEDTSSGWVGPKPIQNIDDIETLDLRPEIHIDTPYITVEETDSKLIIKGGKIKGDDHFSSSWVIKDKVGNIIFSSIEDKNNLEKIEIDKYKNKLDKYNVLNISVLYKGKSGISSKISNKHYILNKYGIELESNTTDLIPEQDIVFKINTNNFFISKIIIRDIDEEETELRYENLLTNTIVIPKNTLLKNRTYYLDIYVKNEKDGSSHYAKRVLFNTINDNVNSFYINPNINYDNEIKLSGHKSKELFINGYYESLSDNKIVITNGNDFKYTKYNGNLEKLQILNIEMTDKIENDFIGTLLCGENTYVIIANEKDKNYSTIYIFKYVKLANKLLLKRKIELSAYKKINTVGLKPYTYSYLDNSIYLLVLKQTDNSAKTIKIDVLNGTVVERTSRPDSYSLGATMEYLENGKIISLGGSSRNLAYLFNISTNKWDVIKEYPDYFVSKNLVSIMRNDGKVMFLDIDSNESKYFIYDKDRRIFTIYSNNNELVIEGKSIIRTVNGNIFRLSNDTKTSIFKY